jgi:hypothetical protein
MVQARKTLPLEMTPARQFSTLPQAGPQLSAAAAAAAAAARALISAARLRWVPPV